MAEKLVIYKKGESAVAFTGDADKVTITGLAAGTVVATGDYELAVQDADGIKPESDHEPVAGFTVNAAKKAAPENVTVTPTDDGAVVTGN